MVISKIRKRFFRLRWIIAVVLLIASMVRLSRVAELGYFMIDEERDAFLVRRMLVDHRPLLIGGAIPGGINVGPAFFYLSSIPYALSQLNPIGPAYAAAVIGVAGVIAIYLVGKELFGRQVGLLAMIFSGFSLLNIIYHRPWWPLTLSQLVTLITYLSLIKLTAKGKMLNDLNHLTVGRGLRIFKYSVSWWLILTVALIVGVQSDPSTFSLIPLSVIWLWRQKKDHPSKDHPYLKAVGVFLLAHITWFIFELRHDFLNTRAIISLLTFKGLSLTDVKDNPLKMLQGPFEVLRMTAAMVYRLFIHTGPLDVTKQINPAEMFLQARIDGVWWPVAGLLLLVISYYVISSFKKGLSFRRRKDSPLELARQLLSLHLLISLGGILVYTTLFPGYVHEWMWAFMFPTFFLIIAYLILTLKKILGDSFKDTNYGLLVAWCLWQLLLFTKLSNVAGLDSKLAVVRQAQAEIAGRPYELRSEGSDALRYGGWRYLFTLDGDPPVKSYMDYVFRGWVYPESGRDPEVIITVFNPTDTTPLFRISPEISRGVDQEDGDYDGGFIKPAQLVLSTK